LSGGIPSKVVLFDKSKHTHVSLLSFHVKLRAEPLSTLFCILGIPSCVHSDRGASFVSHKTRPFLTERGIAFSTSTSYQPKRKQSVWASWSNRLANCQTALFLAILSRRFYQIMSQLLSRLFFQCNMCCASPVSVWGRIR